MARCRGLAGVVVQGKRATGFPRNLGEPFVSTWERRQGHRMTKPRADSDRAPSESERISEHSVVPRNGGKRSEAGWANGSRSSA